MAVAQMYETTLIDRELNLVARFVSVPSRYLKSSVDRWDERVVADALGINLLRQVDPGYLVPSAAVALAAPLSEYVMEWPTDVDLENRHYRFAEYCTMARAIPFEASPLSAESVGGSRHKGDRCRYRSVCRICRSW